MRFTHIPRCKLVAKFDRFNNITAEYKDKFASKLLKKHL